MDSERSVSALVMAALLADRRNLPWRTRSEIIARTQSSGNVSPHALECAHGAGLRFRKATLERAVITAQTWAAQGIFVLATKELQAPSTHLYDLPPVLFATGLRELLDLPAAAILVSRQGRRVSPKDAWLTAVKAQVVSARSRGMAIVSSYGTIPYSVVTYLARKGPLIIACDDHLPAMERYGAKRLHLQYGDLFFGETTLFLSPFPPGVMPSRTTRWTMRDRLVAACASVMMPVHVRAGGTMAEILDVASRSGIPIEARDQESSAHQSPRAEELSLWSTDKPGRVTIQSRGYQESVALDVTVSGDLPAPLDQTRPSLPPTEYGETAPMSHSGDGPSARCRRLEPQKQDISAVGDLIRDEAYLFHYTRACPGPWPDQAMADYCRELVDDCPGSEHTGFDTLQRILKEARVRGSFRLTRGMSPVVCFTELAPEEIGELIRWRRGLLRWSYEPYGLGIRQDQLFQRGARPVIYGVEEAVEDLGPELDYLFQPHGRDGRTWMSEREWRLRGDLVLSDLGRNDLLVFAAMETEVQTLRERFPWRAARAVRRTG